MAHFAVAELQALCRACKVNGARSEDRRKQGSCLQHLLYQKHWPG
eukprot:CAMPEP_0173396398 /NCGR_PEP_ID=MMETSP1356-20130122/35385_1 /TAXON_ID=77927 ORGANISM="Hemiselmis virescens, Strain PCC157" /NCGR_SAMPLE_ID=MMETSP1356 /ASSEMBLY_ACC=CAM_ASM_000847 /LENGTH=44 /DNA_ID= /DNA_START= /DNA_END= /DNA_ORIENTATION=